MPVLRQGQRKGARCVEQIAVSCRLIHSHHLRGFRLLSIEALSDGQGDETHAVLDLTLRYPGLDAHEDKPILIDGPIFPRSIAAGVVTLECHAGCACTLAHCALRPSQRGPWPSLCVKKTVNRGWGLFSQTALGKDALVAEYVGELLSAEESMRRARSYDEEGLNYLLVVREEKVSVP